MDESYVGVFIEDAGGRPRFMNTRASVLQLHLRRGLPVQLYETGCREANAAGSLSVFESENIPMKSRSGALLEAFAV